VLFRSVELGLRVHDVPSRPAYVFWNLRHHALLTFVPLCGISAWIELIDRLALGAARRTGLFSGFVDSVTKVVRNDLGWGEGFKAVLGTSSVRDGVIDVFRGGGHLFGVLCVFILSPLVVRLVWDVQTLGKGPTRDALERLLERTGVRVRDILLWRTHGTLVNAAAVGVIRPLRYILLSDALLESLPERQVQAVMAHEIAHVRLRHMLWMGISVVSMGVFLSLVASLALWAAGVGPEVAATPRPGESIEVDSLSWGTGLVTSGAVLGLTLSLFGFVSRRFEWQADAFAVRVLSHLRPRADAPPQIAWTGLPNGIEPPVVAGETVAGEIDPARATTEAAESMAGALGSVATLAHIPISRSSWRHGSIAVRQARVRGLVGQPLAHERGTETGGVISSSRRLPIDRSVRALKWGAIVLLCVSIGVIAAFGSYS
jgi:STE24 endopeptidase